MKRGLSSLLFLSSLLISSTALSVTVYECRNAEGEDIYQDRCPPGTEVVGEKSLRGDPKVEGPDIDAIASANPIKLYVAPECDACDLVRSYLSTSGFPFTEKNVVDDLDAQAELKDKNGAITVPIMLVGDKTVRGYNKPVMENALSGAGYPVGDTE